MSKPNLLGFTVSLGFFRNQRVRFLRSILATKIKREIPFAEIAPILFLAPMAYCGENSVLGDLSGYTTELWREIFGANNIQVSPAEAEIIRAALEECGLTDGGKIRSWAKFNPHLVRHEKTVKDRRKAGKAWQRMRQQKALQEAQETVKKSPTKAESAPAKNSAKNGAENRSENSQVWGLNKKLELIERQLQTAQGEERKQLVAARKKLLSRATGVEASPPAPAAPAPARPRKISKGEADQTLLIMARQLLSNSPDMLEKRHFLALWAAGDKLPAEVLARFRSIIEKKEAEHFNPVPG